MGRGGGTLPRSAFSGALSGGLSVGGGLFTGAYLFRVLASSLAQPQEGLETGANGSRAPGREGVVLTLALASIALGFVPLGAFGLVLIGRAG